MVSMVSKRRRAVSTVVLAVALVTACSDRPEATPSALVIPPAAPSLAPGGPGTYVGEAVNDLGTPVEVEVRVASDLTAAPGPLAAEAGAYIRRVAALLDFPVPEVRFVTVEIDNTGQVDVVRLPDNVDVLDPAGSGANFRPAYDVVQESLDLLPGASPAVEQGRTLVQRLLVREDEVRPGKIETVPYVTSDVVTDVSQVVVNGSLARITAP